jgi:GNAT superfamily N-acetyltransferase
VAEDGLELVGMASAEPMRADDGAGAVVPGGCFLSYLYVVPERWGEGIGGLILDAVLADAQERNYRRIRLWTHEDNERSHLLYGSRGFRRTGRISGGEGEWARDLAEAARGITGDTGSPR